MGIWIRSQDKDDLFYAKTVEICKRKNDYAVLLNGIEKGRYSSKEKVIKVIDKATPKRAIIISNDKNILIFGCPKCGKRTHTNFQRNYCGECGQKLDWSDEE